MPSTISTVLSFSQNNTNKKGRKTYKNKNKNMATRAKKKDSSVGQETKLDQHFASQPLGNLAQKFEALE
jgi:hypothetical protein